MPNKVFMCHDIVEKVVVHVIPAQILLGLAMVGNLIRLVRGFPKQHRKLCQCSDDKFRCILQQRLVVRAPTLSGVDLHCCVRVIASVLRALW